MKNSKFSKCFKSIFSVLLALGLSTISACVGGGYRDLSLPKNELIIENPNDVSECDDDIDVAVSATTNSLRASTSSTGNVLVPELYGWGSDTTAVSSSWLTLSQYLIGDSVTSSNWRSTLIEYAASSPNAEDFRAVTYGTEKTAGQDVRVTFGGYTWYVMYLSLNSDGRAVLTLWLDNYPQSGIRDGTGSSDSITWYWYNGYLFSLQTVHMSADKEDLNFTDYDVNNLAGYSDVMISGGSAFFNCAGGNGAYFLKAAPFVQRCIAPYYMPWQEYESAREILGLPYDLPNEAWSGSLPDDGFYSSYYNYSKYVHPESDYNCQLWAEPLRDTFPYTKLFIPSLSEIGYSGVSGLWGASTEQRSCSLSGEIPNYFFNLSDRDVFATTWTRSGNYKQTYGYYFIKSSGDGKGIGTTHIRVLRPCVHLLVPTTEYV